MSRYLTGRAFTLSHNFDEDEGTPLVIASVTVTVKNSAGTTVSTGAATNSAGTWSYTVPAQPQGPLTVTWATNGGLATDTTYEEVVGAVTFTVKEFRGSDIDLSSTARFTPEDIRLYRDMAEAEFEKITGRSFTPRTKTVTVEYRGDNQLLTGVWDIAAVDAAVGPSGALDMTDWTVDPLGVIEGVSGLSEGDLVTLTVDYGFRAVPADVKHAAILRTKTLIVRENSGIPDRATSFIAAEGGTFTLATPGLRGSETGVPEVDAILGRYRYRLLQDLVGG